MSSFGSLGGSFAFVVSRCTSRGTSAANETPA